MMNPNALQDDAEESSEKHVPEENLGQEHTNQESKTLPSSKKHPKVKKPYHNSSSDESESEST